MKIKTRSISLPWYNYLILYLCFAFSISAQARIFADKDYYLIDSLVLEDLNDADSILIEKKLEIFHLSKNDTVRLYAISELIEECLDFNVWPRYNRYLLSQSEELIKTTSSKTILDVLISLKGRTHLNKALIYKLKGPVSKIEENYQLGIKCFEQCGDTERLAFGLMSLAVIHSETGKYLQSIDLAERAIILLKGVNKTHNTLTCYNYMAAIQHNVGNEEASEYYTRLTYLLAVEQNDIHLEATCLNNIVLFNCRRGNYNDALDTAFIALKSIEKINDSFQMLIVSHRIAEVYVYLQEFDEALVWAQKTDSLNQDLKSIEFKIKSDQIKSDIFIHKKEYKKAEKVGLSGLRVARENNQTTFQILLLKRLARISRIKGDFKQASEYLFELLELQFNS